MAVLVLGIASWLAVTRYLETHALLLAPAVTSGDGCPYGVPLDPESPSPKFRANALQNDGSPVEPRIDPALRPWAARTGKGVFVSPVVDARDRVYADDGAGRTFRIEPAACLGWSCRCAERELNDLNGSPRVSAAPRSRRR